MKHTTKTAYRQVWEGGLFMSDGLWATEQTLKLRRGVTGAALLAWLQDRWKDFSFRRGDGGIMVHAVEVMQPPPGFTFLFDDGRNVRKHYVGWLALSQGADDAIIVEARLSDIALQYTAEFHAITESLRGWCEPTAEVRATPTPAQEEGAPLNAGNGEEQTGEGGRPRNADYDWAWGEIQKGRSEGDVYDEWCNREDVKRRWVEMTDPREAFRAAMKAPRGTCFGSADGGAGMGPTNPAYSPQQEQPKPPAIEGSTLWGEPVARRFRLATRASEYWAWLVGLYTNRTDEKVSRDDSGIVVWKATAQRLAGYGYGYGYGSIMTETFRFNLQPTDEGLEVEAVLLDAEEYNDFLSLVRYSKERFAPQPEPPTEAATPTPAQEEGDPLSQVPEGQIREFVRLWRAGEESARIAKRFGMESTKKVGDRASELRSTFGDSIVPYRQSRGRLEDDEE